MAMIVYGWGNRFIKKRFAGVKACPQCGMMTEQYVERKFFNISICYIPVIWIPTKRCYVCEGCGAVVELEKDKYKEMLAQYKNMPKRKKVLSAYAMLEQIAPTLSDEERTVDNIYNKIAESVKFTDEEAPFFKEIINNYLEYGASLAAAEEAAADELQAESKGSEESAEQTEQKAAIAEAQAETVSKAVKDNPLDAIPKPGQQNIYPVQNADGPTSLYMTQPVKKKKWGWLVAGILQIFVTLFCLLVLGVNGADLFTDGVGFGIMMIALFGVIPIGLNVLFFYLYAKK